MNCPDDEQKIEIDLRGDTLRATEDCANTTRGSLQGFFCEAYSPVLPPEMIG